MPPPAMCQGLRGVESVSESTSLGNFIFTDEPEAVQLVSEEMGLEFTQLVQPYGPPHPWLRGQ